MTKNLNNAGVGDKKSPPLKPSEGALRSSADNGRHLQLESTPKASVPSGITDLACALKAASSHSMTGGSCKRSFWFSFFFDGTGNNLEADIGLMKHSCIARLFLVHKPMNLIEGVFPIYIAGLGTHFPEIGDEGGNLGKAFGKGGIKRLDYALAEFDRLLRKPLKDASNPANAIREINLATFGFSRGAALARAFVNKLMEERCVLKGGKWNLKAGGWPVNFRFMGLFDTVASVGNPMSRNNTDFYNPVFSDVKAVIDERLDDYPYTRPEALAFSSAGRPGADPAPGRHAGHDDWGKNLRIHHTVEEVWHFVAAHESRNSFPLDSISNATGTIIAKPGHFHEVLYLGAHSDVGGGYAPGEGGKGILPSENLCLIPLRHMYDHALRKGVPMLVEWKRRNQDDFRVDAKLIEVYNYYVKAVGALDNLGSGINKHMRYYFAWRFRLMRQEGRRGNPEHRIIVAYKDNFQNLQTSYTKELDQAKKREVLAHVSRNALIEVNNMDQNEAAGGAAGIQASSERRNALARAEEELQQARAARLKVQAKRDAIPDMSLHQELLDFFDSQLLSDVEAIRSAMHRGAQGRNRSELRPHYAALLDAWENEFVKNNGLKDETIISFFDRYMHDSLAGFAKDATLPSDPRVVYVGEDIKLRFASEDNENVQSRIAATV